MLQIWHLEASLVAGLIAGSGAVTGGAVATAVVTTAAAESSCVAVLTGGAALQSRSVSFGGP